jgi:hypothetical protein
MGLCRSIENKWGTAIIAARQGNTPVENRVKANQVFSQAHFRVCRMGKRKTPFTNPARIPQSSPTTKFSGIDWYSFFLFLDFTGEIRQKPSLQMKGQFWGEGCSDNSSSLPSLSCISRIPFSCKVRLLWKAI